jgi:hypothetical protein
MVPAPAIDELAREIHLRRVPNGPLAGRGPYILFIGEGCARAAGAPSREDIARTALRTFGFEPSADPRIPSDMLWALFKKHTASLSSSQFGRMLRSLYGRVPVPEFYQDLAALIREQYFPLILTMNFDTLLEQALSQSGVRSSDYRVTTFGASRISSGSDNEQGRPPLTHIVKLHGDLAQNTVLVTPEQIDEALRRSMQWIKSDLAGDIIMVAHIVDPADPIDRWLSHSHQRQLWWVDRGGPPPDISRWGSDVHAIGDELGRPGVFLSQLALRLLRAPDTNAPDAAAAPLTLEDMGTSPGDSTTGAVENEILRNQSVLYNLQQESTARERPPQLQAQIIYHKRVITKLEDRLRADTDTQGRIVHAFEAVIDAARRAAAMTDAPADMQGVVTHLERLRTDLVEAFARPEPNQFLVSAALGAALAIADRLLSEFGTELINPEDVKRLAGFMPTAAGNVVV